jgi:hypothetical protein
VTVGHTHSCVARMRWGRHVVRVVGDPCVIVPALARAAVGGRWTWSRPGTYFVPLDVADAVISALKSAGVRVLVIGRWSRVPPVDLDCCRELLADVLGAEPIT